jgi:DNA helicase-2/ATP-dependent DNA helicase PcrA
LPATPWDSARESARATRAGPLAGDDEATPASVLIARGLEAAALSVFLRPPDDALLSGAHAVLDPEALAIWVRSDAAPELRSVYLAHELAHFYLHENGDPCRCHEADFSDIDGFAAVGYGPRQRRETEANVWAREFLLPVALASRLFFDDGLTAQEIAARLALSPSVVVSQLGESLLPAPGPECAPAPPPAAGPVFPLDPSQAEAAYAVAGPLLVGAGPGTGKTRTLTSRVLYLTNEQNVRPENLLALTFSRKAAEEMRERIAALAPNVGRRAAISTFHAYGLDLLRRWGDAAGLPPTPILLDLPDSCALLERRAGTLGLTALRYLHDPAFPLPDILRAIGRAKEDLISPADYARRAHETGDAKLADVARVYAAYEALLREKGALDFADLICRALALLAENPDVLAAEQAQWRQVLVDEYQDVNRAGALLVGLLSGRDHNAGLWAVGDLRQAIYRFRGASPANVSRFQADFPNGRRTELRVNYRSQPALVRLFGRASGDGEAAWSAARPETVSTPAVLAVAADDVAQADGIARKMHGFHESGIGWADQVALCRTRGQARALRAALTARGVPVASGPDENNLLAKPDARNLLALLSRVSEPGGPARYRFPELPDGLAGVFARGGDAYDLWAHALWDGPGWARSIEDREAVATLLSLARTFRDRAAMLVGPGDVPAREFLRHVRRMARLGATFGGSVAEDTGDRVRVLTVHASKGLEFPVVFVPNLSAGKFPARPQTGLLPPLPDEISEVEPLPGAADSDAAEEERLFFVALTRARDHLVMSRALKYGKISAKPSPLLAAVETAPELRHEVWESAAETITFSDAAAPVEIAPLDAPVTAGDAELYLRCPRRYYYRRVLDLPEGERTAYSSFKRAVSEALRATEPAAALEAAWAAYGPEATHAHADLYRRAAEEILSDPNRAATPPASAPSTLTVAFDHGRVTVRPESATGAGDILESRTYRKPPDTDEAPLDRHLALLQAAGAPTGATVQMRYLQNGRVLPVTDKPKIRAKYLAEYDQALRGIAQGLFPPAPAANDDCATCPYLFICPD